MENFNPSRSKTQRLLQELSQLNRSNLGDNAERVQIKEALSAAISQIETPWETALRIVSTQPALGATLKVCYDVGLFEKWVQEHGGRHATGEELANLVGVDPLLLVRLLRHLHATQTIRQISPGIYALTDFSKALTTPTPPISLATPICPPTSKARSTQTPPTRPTQTGTTNWHHMRGLSRFDELKQRPGDMAVFQDVMTANAASKTPWTELFPTNVLVDAGRLGVPLLVDVGGGAGHDTERLRKRLIQTAPGALVLQDMAPVIERAAVHETVVVMAHDFFREQPIKGATAYYLHNVLHDWPNARAVDILSNIATAAEPNYSRVLIHEIVITDTLSALDTTSDLQMMMVLSSFERTEAVWRDIVTAAGLDVVKIWQAPGSADSIIEAVKRK